MQTHSHVLGLIHAPLFNAYESTTEVHYSGLVSLQHSENSLKVTLQNEDASLASAPVRIDDLAPLIVPRWALNNVCLPAL